MMMINGFLIQIAINGRARAPGNKSSSEKKHHIIFLLKHTNTNADKVCILPVCPLKGNIIHKDTEDDT